MPSRKEFFGKKDPYRRFEGVYYGVVVDVDDPDKCGKIKVKCPEVYGNDTSPWVKNPSFFGGGPDLGALFVPDKGSNVQIKFKNGNPQLPVLDGTLAPRGSVPFVAKGKADRTRADKGKMEMTSFRDDSKIKETEDKYATKYPLNRSIKTTSGHLLEFDDTPGAERVNLHHRSGTYIEMYPDGTMLVNVKSKQFETYKGDTAQERHGNVDSQFRKDVGIVIDRDGRIKIGGSLELICKGDISFFAEGEISLFSKRGVNISSEDDVAISAKRKITAVGEQVNIIDSDTE